MKINKIAALIISLIVIVASAYVALNIIDKNDNTESQTTDSDDDTNPPVGSIVTFGDAVNAFSFDIFEKFFSNSENTDNIFNSGYSIFVALAMTYEGAQGITAEEMKDVLNIERDNESFHNYMKSLYEYLNLNDEYNISTANALWIREYYPILQKYKELILEFYGGNSTDIDFSNPEQAAEIINNWIESKTNNLIKNLISPDDIDPIYTTLILTNAIYFKGTWKIQFDEDNTTELPFYLSDGTTKDVDTMKIIDTQDEFNFTQNDDMKIIELPYTGDDISMMIFLPKDGYDLNDIIGKIDHQDYLDLIESMNKYEVDLYLPKFKIETPVINLNDYLQELGINDAFNPGANFSNMTELNDLYISKVLHKAFIDVNEEGTEAAAATAVIMDRLSTSEPPEDSRIEFKADHPFFFTIHHKDTNTILFSGIVADPSYTSE